MIIIVTFMQTTCGLMLTAPRRGSNACRGRTWLLLKPRSCDSTVACLLPSRLMSSSLLLEGTCIFSRMRARSMGRCSLRGCTACMSRCRSPV